MQINLPPLPPPGYTCRFLAEGYKARGLILALFHHDGRGELHAAMDKAGNDEQDTREFIASLRLMADKLELTLNRQEPPSDSPTHDHSN